jgi:hypothetical protein
MSMFICIPGLSSASLEIKESDNGNSGTAEFIVLQVVTYQYNLYSLFFPVILALTTLFIFWEHRAWIFFLVQRREINFKEKCVL